MCIALMRTVCASRMGGLPGSGLEAALWLGLRPQSHPPHCSAASVVLYKVRVFTKGPDMRGLPEFGTHSGPLMSLPTLSGWWRERRCSLDGTIGYRSQLTHFLAAWARVHP